jgi:hypothetical protein
MKLNLLFATCTAAIICSGTANAQLGVSKVAGKIVPTVTLGVKLGANMQQLSGSSSWESSYKTGILGGAFISVDKQKMGVRVEGLIKTAKFNVHNSNVDVNTVALDVPALFEYKIIKRVWLQAGPMFSSILSAKNSSGNDVKENFKSSDISAVVGAEIALPLKLTVGARYIKGFTNMNNTNIPGTWKNTCIQLSVGYRFLN